LPANGEPVANSSEFNKLLLEAVDHALLVLGETARLTIYDCVESSYQIKREEIPEKLEALHGALTDLLGRGGSMVERVAAENLYRSLHLTFEPNENWALVDYVNHAKRIMSLG
jgi:hypothetical protein